MNQKLRKVLSMVIAMAMILNFALVGSVTPAEAWSPQEHKDLSRAASADGQILLENRVEDGTTALPIAEGTTVAMFGRAQIDYVRGGGGSGNTNVEYTRNILQGMQVKETEGKIDLVPELTAFYTEQVTTNGIRNDANITITDEVWNAAAAATETAVVVIGRYSSEGSDRNATAGDYYLSDAEYALITRVAAEFDKTIVVLNIGAVMDTSWIKGDNGVMHEPVEGLDAVLCGWQGGMEGGLATADILVGDVNPSGKTVDTWAQDYSYYPSSETFKESTSYVNYTEDIFVGYRYFETIPGAADYVNYEFGYGLSYTTFSTVVDSIEVVGDEIVTTATVTNTGSVPGKQVVQVYFSAPRGDLTKPAKELAAFDKTGLLEPGASETLVMSFPITDMSSYDDTGVIQKSAYVMEAGDYTVFVGNSIRDGAYADFKYTLEEDLVAEQLTELCPPVSLDQRMLEDGTYAEVNAVNEELLHHTVAAEGQTRIEMEHYIDGSDNLRIESFYDESFNRLQCLAYMQTAGNYAEYDLNVESEGQYAVYLCYALGYADKSNCLSVTVDGVLQTKATFNAVQTGDGNGASEWYNFVLCEEPLYVNLREGNNRLRITANVNSQPNYDYMIIERVGEYDGAYERKVAAEGTKIEAETYDAHIVGIPNSNGTTWPVRIETFTYADGSAAECLAYMNYRGNGVEYYIDVAEAGQYELILNAANGRAAFDFNPLIKVEHDDGKEELFIQTITAERTCGGDETGLEGLPDGWYGFADLEPITINLPEGNCVLSINAQANSFVNVDYFTLKKVGEYADPTVMLSSTEATTIEGEDFVSSGWPVSKYPMVIETAPETAGDFAGTTCTAHVNYVGNYLTWWLNAETAGSYTVILNVANGYDPYIFAPKATVNGVEQAVSIEIPGTWDGESANRWYNFADAPSFTIELEEGLNIFTMECVEEDVFPNINTLTFEKLSDNPVVAAEGVTKIEAEAYSATNSAVTESFSYPDATAGTSVGMAARNRYIEYNLYVEEAGVYDLVLSGSNGYATYNLNPAVTVNGEAFPQLVSIPQTCRGGTGNTDYPSGWFTFQDMPAISVELPAGEVTLRLSTAVGNRFPNVDYFTLEKTDAEAADRVVSVSASETTVIEAENYTGFSADDVINIEAFDGGVCTAYMNYTGAYIEYDLDVAEAGIYELVLSASNGRDEYNFLPGVQVIHDEYPDASWEFIACPRTCQGDVDEDGDGTTDYQDWWTFADLEAITVALPAGESTLRLNTASNNTYPNLDAIKLTKVAEYEAPVTKVEGETVISAIDFNDTAYGTDDVPVRLEQITAGDLTGEYCLCFMNYIGNSVTYLMDVAQAGSYDITMKVANGYAEFAFEPIVTVNGTEVDVSLTIPSTRDDANSNRWYNFMDAPSFTVDLVEGLNVLTMECTVADAFPNVYSITVTPAAADATTTTVEDETDEVIMLLDVYNAGKDDNGDYVLMDEFIAQLTVAELAELLSAQGNRDGGNTQGWGNNMTYGIPLVMTADGPQGIRIGYNCTAWPISTNLSSSWDVDVVAAVGTAAATEAHYHNMDIWLAPGMNIHRDPLCGRNFEYYSEDPQLTGKMAASITKAVQAEGVAISLKHFAANNKEQNRSSSDSRMTERALREIYLRGFEIAVKEADPWTIMSSYNYINGEETAENYQLITGILRTEWGYDGVVETDWGNNSNHVLEVLAGNDVKMTNSQPEQLVAAVESGRLTRQHLETGAIRVLELIMKVNYFHDKIVNVPVVDIDAGTNFKAAENIIWSQTARGEATEDTDGGSNLGYCDAGAYTEYQINVITGGTYTLQARVASAAGNGAFNVVIDGEVIASFDVPNTGAYQNWTTINTVENVPVTLTEGRHTMRFEWTESGSNLNWILFNLEQADETDPTDPSEPTIDTEELEAAVKAAEAAQAAAEAAQKAAEEAQAAAEAAQAQAAEDKAAAEAAQAAAEAAQKLAEDAQAAAEAAKTAAEEQNAAAAQEAAAAATSAAAAAEASASAAKAAETAQAAQTAAEAAQKEAEAAAAAAAEDKTAAEAAASAAETAKAQAEAAKAAAEKAQAAAEDAADAAEESNTEAAKSAAEAADSAAGSAASAAAAAESAKASAASAKAAAESQKAAEEAEEEARRLAEQAEADRLAAEKAAAEAEKLKADAEKAAAESALNLEKLDAELALNEYYEELKADATATEKAALSEAAKAARAAVKAAESSEAVAEAVQAGMAALDNALCLAKNFTDVDLDEWYHDAIDFVLKEGIMSGNGDGTFTPEASLTRAMLVQILYNIEGRPAVETDKSFSDVESDDWYYDAVMWAAENDIVLGYEDGSFGAEDDVTREQMVTILYRYAGEPEVTAEEIIFADSDEISDWAVEAVLWAYENKIVQGVGNDMFDPAGASQRAAAAQVMMNYFAK